METATQIGSLGLPGTRWAEGTVLDSETQARGLSNLLWELLQLGDLCIDPPLCVAMMGLGSGANAVLQFSATHLLDAKFARLRDAVRFVALVNPFPVTPDTSLERQQVKRSLQTLKRVLEIGSHHEQLQALLSSLFSNEYITQVSEHVDHQQRTLPSVHDEKYQYWIVNHIATSHHLRHTLGMLAAGRRSRITLCSVP